MCDAFGKNMIENGEDIFLNKPLNQFENNMLTISSIKLNLNSEFCFESLLKALPLMVNLKTISIECDGTARQKQINTLFKELYENKKTLEINLEINSQDPLRILTLQPIQLISLFMVVYLSPENQIDLLLISIESFKEIQQLELELRCRELNENQGLERFIQSFRLNSKSLFKLTLNFSEIISISDQEASELGKQISRLSSLKQLFVYFNSTKVEPKGCEQFFKELSMSTFKLETFAISFEIQLQKCQLQHFTKFLNNQHYLQNIIMKNIKIPNNLFEILMKNLKKLVKISSIHFDFERNNLENESLEQISEFLIERSDSLQEIEISFNKQIFEGESTLGFGKALVNINNLLRLSLQFEKIISNEVILDFSQKISSCISLQYLFIYLSGFGSDNFVEWEQEEQGQTIFQCKEIQISQNDLFVFETVSSCQFHYYLINLMIASKCSNVKSLSIEFPSLQYCYDTYISQNIEKLFQQFLESRFILEKYIQKSKNLNQIQQAQQEQIILNNSSTLTRFETKSPINSKQLYFLSKCSNLLSIKCQNQTESISFLDLVESLPNLIKIHFERKLGNEKFSWSPLIKSNLTQLFINSHSDEDKLSGQLSVDCINKRMATIISIVIFKRFIFNYLMYKPIQMIQELWIDT